MNIYENFVHAGIEFRASLAALEDGNECMIFRIVDGEPDYDYEFYCKRNISFDIDTLLDCIDEFRNTDEETLRSEIEEYDK